MYPSEGVIPRMEPAKSRRVYAQFGTLRFAPGLGEGAEARQPLSIAVVGGLVVSQFLTLYITLEIYLYLDHLPEWMQGENRAVESRKEVVASM
jgi:HAE1 family hydrophobic/amphiphilic exporter-1